jgi:hypothetical protein
MKFARIVFALAGTWGVVVLSPLFFLVDVAGKAYAPPLNYPHFFYGFFAVAMAWQFAFFVIASNPVRYRPMMIPAVIEKLGFVVTCAMLWSRGQIPAADAFVAVPDAVLCALFVASFVKARAVGASYA